MFKKVLILLILVACSSTTEESPKEEENNSTDLNLFDTITEVDIYQYGDGPYSLEQCSEVGNHLKNNLLVTTTYILSFENWSEYIRSSDNLETLMYWDNLLGYKWIKHLNEAQAPYSDYELFFEENDVSNYLKKHLKDINKIYIAKDISSKVTSGLIYDFKELSIMTQGSDREFLYLIEFNYDEENIYYLPYKHNLLNEKNESYESLENNLSNVTGFNSSIFVDTGLGYRGQQSFSNRAEYFYNELVDSYSYGLVSNGEFSNDWYINILDIHLDGLNKFSFFLNQFTECQGSLEFSGLQEKLINQYKGIENRKNNYISYASQFSGTIYPSNDWDYSIKFDSLW